MPMNPRLLKPTASASFRGGDLSVGSLYDAALRMVNGSNTAPTSGGTLTVNGESLASYDYAIRSGETLASFNASDWFTNTQDTRSAWCVVRGDLTINSGVTFTPPVRKLFTVLVVTGNLTVNGTISMTARGANHSGTGNSGGATTARAIRIANGTFSGIQNPEIPAAGGAGGGRRTGPGGFNGNAGTNGSGGGCGGGGGGGFNSGAAIQSGAGSAGTSFSGGSGGGGTAGFNTGADAVTNGGAGGLIACQSGFSGGGSGAGNPAGVVVTAANSSATVGNDGTGGVLIVVVLGTLSGSGSVSSNGSTGGVNANPSGSGGCSGGGSVTILAATDSSSISPQANGGAVTGGSGGFGGAGTARKLAI